MIATASIFDGYTRLDCHQCGKRLKTPAAAGRVVTCPRCGSDCRVPGEVKSIRPDPRAAAKALVKERRAGFRRHMIVLGLFLVARLALTVAVYLYMFSTLPSHAYRAKEQIVPLLFLMVIFWGGISAFVFARRRWAANLVLALSALGPVYNFLTVITDQFNYYQLIVGTALYLVAIGLSYRCRRSGQRLDEAVADLRRQTARYPDEE